MYLRVFVCLLGRGCLGCTCVRVFVCLLSEDGWGVLACVCVFARQRMVGVCLRVCLCVCSSEDGWGVLAFVCVFARQRMVGVYSRVCLCVCSSEDGWCVYLRVFVYLLSSFPRLSPS